MMGIDRLEMMVVFRFFHLVFRGWLAVGKRKVNEF
jgi:hypothetical protein